MKSDWSVILTGAHRYGVLLFLFLAACGDQQILRPAGPGAQPAAVERIFLVTNRLMSSDPEDRGARSEAVSRAVLDVGIPPTHAVGQVEYVAGDPDPSRSFALMSSTGLRSEAEFLDAVDGWPYDLGSEVVGYVHGYNNTLGSAVFRHAQMAHDFGLEGPQVTFAWPSAADPLGYVYDRDSIDIARDDLEALLAALALGERRILLVGHSMGAQLVTETLRQMSIGGENRTLAQLSGVVLISPDIDVEVFKSQVERIDPMPQRFVVFLSQRDRVLGLSAGLVRQPARLGSTSDLPLLQSLGVSVVDLTALSGRGGNEHLLALSSPTSIAIAQGLRQVGPTFGETGPTALDVADALVGGVIAPLKSPAASQ